MEKLFEEKINSSPTSHTTTSENFKQKTLNKITSPQYFNISLKKQTNKIGALKRCCFFSDVSHPLRMFEWDNPCDHKLNHHHKTVCFVGTDENLSSLCTKKFNSIQLMIFQLVLLFMSVQLAPYSKRKQTV